jgi:hypothetical protein
VSALTSSGIDFYQFWAVARAAAVAPELDIYDDVDRGRIGQRFLGQAEKNHERAERRFAAKPEDRALAKDLALATKRLETARFRRRLDTVSTPFLYTCFRAFASGDYRRDESLFTLTCLTAGAAAVAALAFALGFGGLRALAAVAIFAFAFEPVTSDVRVGNVNLLQLGAIAAALLAGRLRAGRGVAGGALAGVLWGLAVTFKPNVAFAVLLLGLGWLAERRLARSLALAGGVLAGAAVGVLGGALTFGSLDVWSRWLAELPRLAERSYPLMRGNYGPAQLLLEQTGRELSGLLTAAFLLLAASAVVAGALRARGQARWQGADAPFARDVARAGLGLAVWLLAAPLVWLHYYALVVPLGLVLLRPASGERGPRRPIGIAVAVAGLAAVAAQPLASVAGLTEHHEFTLLVAGGTLGLLGLGCAELLRRPPAVRSGPDAAPSSPAPGESGA